jgi:4'-phosphopantetheinyl transferase
MPEEMSAYRDIPRQGQVIAFFRMWTRKEAVLKAAAVGLSVNPRDFSVASVEKVLGLWSVFDLDTGPGYAAALATDRPDCVIEEQAWRWE